MKSKETRLTPKQQIFIDEYLISLNASEAARKAGYSPKTAFRTGQENLQKPAIQKAIQDRLQEKQDELIAKQDELMEFWTVTMRNDTEDTRNRLKASEMLGKRYALFTDKIAYSEKIEVKCDIDLSIFSDEELDNFESLISKAENSSVPKSIK